MNKEFGAYFWSILYDNIVFLNNTFTNNGDVSKINFKRPTCKEKKGNYKENR